MEHLALIAIEAEMVPLRNAVLIPDVHDAFSQDGHLTNPAMEAAADILLEDLAWWADVLQAAARRGSLPPAAARRTAGRPVRAAS